MTTILTKKKDTTGAPAPGDLTNSAGGAELAVNTFDKRLYTKDAGGNVVEIGTNPAILNIDNIQIDGNTISSTNTNGPINLAPNGTGQVVFNAGAVGTPIITTTGDTNTGIFFPAADTIAFTEGGVESGRFTSTGALQLNNNLTFSGTGNRITGDFSNATSANRVAFQTSTTNDNTFIPVLSNGTGTVTGIELFNSSDSANASVLQLSSRASEARIAAPIRGTGTYVPLTFFTSAGERLRIDTSGNVGIGTSSPTALLDVNGNLAITGSARRITGDFSNATIANRLMFQTSTTNGNTGFGIIPNGTSSVAAFQAFSSSTDPANSSEASLVIFGGIETRIASGIRGTGTYLPITFYTNGFEQMRIDTSGNVGIGTSSPTQKLDVRGGITAYDGGTQRTYISNAGEIELVRTAGDAYIDFSTSTAEDFDCRIQQVSDGLRFLTGGNGSSSERMRIDSSGRVGIAFTPSPWDGFKVLQVGTGSVASTTNTHNTSVAANAYFDGAAWRYVVSAAATEYRQNGGEHTWRTAVSGTAGNSIAWTDNMTIKSDGKVCIGTTSATSLLTVGSAVTVVGSAFNSRFNVNAGTLGSTAGNTVKIANLSFDSTTSNHVGLGITAYRNSNGSDWTTTGVKFTYDIDNTTAGYDNLLCFQGGFVGLLTSSPTAPVTIQTPSSTGSAGFLVNNGSVTEIFHVFQNGYFRTGQGTASPFNNTTGSAANVVVASDGALLRSTSSLKYKKEIKDAAHGLAEVLQLRPVTYKGNSKADEGSDKIFGGLIAEEVDAIGLKEFVVYRDDDGTPDALAYGNMVSLLAKAIQEQQQIINDLKARIETLESK